MSLIPSAMIQMSKFLGFKAQKTLVFQISWSKVLNFVIGKTDAAFFSETSVIVCPSTSRHYTEGLCFNLKTALIKKPGVENAGNTR